MTALAGEVIYKTSIYFSSLGDRVLGLRVSSMAVLPNLSSTSDQFDTIDLSDNEIVKLENFPYLNRLGTLLINNNRITRINPEIGEFLPKLHTLILTNNRLVNVVEIDPLASLPKLQTLSLLDNNITKKPNYRLYVIFKLKKLRLLDFRKVKKKERIEAEALFASKEAEEEVKKIPAKAFTPREVSDAAHVSNESQVPKLVAPTPEQIIAIKAAIVNSQTLEEVARLEEAFRSGQIPAELQIPAKDRGLAGANKEDRMETDGVGNSSDVTMGETENASPIEQFFHITSPFYPPSSVPLPFFVLNTPTEMERRLLPFLLVFVSTAIAGVAASITRDDFPPDFIFGAGTSAYQEDVKLMKKLCLDAYREDFTAYADLCFKEFGDRVKYWSTFNEPNVEAILGYDVALFPPGRCSSPFGSNCSAGDSRTEPYISAHNILLAHASAATLYKEKYQVRA
ncbi:U2 small nuclear ribonucleoprotein A' [Platanthera guangdongensis]|uniref:U2 small nuclear ribonucleoprotein A n=1 Tax=Platanthera guangdongensis TaxID=2320717 RepID=A0ABR2MLK3_9ASPA